MLNNILIMAHQDAVFSRTPKGVRESEQNGNGFLSTFAAVVDEQKAGFFLPWCFVLEKG